MDAKSRWRMAIAIPVPFGSTITWLVRRHLRTGMVPAFGLAFMFGLFSLAAIAIIEHEQTRRASLPYRASQVLAKAEAQDRRRYSRAQTRRFGRLANGEKYAPDKATDLIKAIDAIRAPDTAFPISAPRRDTPELQLSSEQARQDAMWADQPPGSMKADDFDHVAQAYRSSDGPLT